MKPSPSDEKSGRGAPDGRKVVGRGRGSSSSGKVVETSEKGKSIQQDSSKRECVSITDEESLNALEKKLSAQNVFGVISQYDFLYLITNDCDYVVKSASKVRCNMLQSAFSNGRIVKVMYKCECDVAPLASYGLVVVGGFDLAIASQILEFPLSTLGYLLKFYRNIQSYSTLAKRTVATPASLDDVWKEGRQLLPLFDSLSSDLLTRGHGRNTFLSAVFEKTAAAITAASIQQGLWSGKESSDLPIGNAWASQAKTIRPPSSSSSSSTSTSTSLSTSPVLSTDQLYRTAGWVTPDSPHNYLPMTPSTISPYVLRRNLTEAAEAEESSEEETTAIPAPTTIFSSNGKSIFDDPDANFGEKILRESDEIDFSGLNLSPTSRDLLSQKRIPRSMAEIYKLSNFNRKRNKVKKKQRDDPQLQFGLEEEDDDDDDSGKGGGGGESSENDPRLDSVYKLLDENLDDVSSTTESGSSGAGEDDSASLFMKEIGWITGDDDHHPSFIPLVDVTSSDTKGIGVGGGEKRDMDERLHKAMGPFGRGKRGGGRGGGGGRGERRTPPGVGHDGDVAGVSPVNVGRHTRSPMGGTHLQSGGETSSPVGGGGGSGRGNRSTPDSSQSGKNFRSPGSEGFSRVRYDSPSELAVKSQWKSTASDRSPSRQSPSIPPSSSLSSSSAKTIPKATDGKGMRVNQNVQSNWSAGGGRGGKRN